MGCLLLLLVSDSDMLLSLPRNCLYSLQLEGPRAYG